MLDTVTKFVGNMCLSTQHPLSTHAIFNVHSSRTAPLTLYVFGTVGSCTGLLFVSHSIQRSRTCPGENSRIFPGVYRRKDEYISISCTCTGDLHPHIKNFKSFLEACTKAMGNNTSQGNPSIKFILATFFIKTTESRQKI